MSLLTDLQRQVEEIKSHEVEQSDELAAQEEFYCAHLLPVMKRAHAYLSEIVDSLTVVAPDINPLYPLNPKAVKGVALSQGQYRYHYDNGTTPHQLDVNCTCTLEGVQEFYLDTEEAALRHSALLDSYHFAFHLKHHRDAWQEIKGATFYLEGPMRVHIRVRADAPGRAIEIDLSNLENTLFKRYKLPPESVDEDLLERLARMLIRQEPTLVKRDLCDTVRDDLRRQVEQEKQLIAEDLAAAGREQEAERQAMEEARLINRAKRSLSAKAERLLDTLKGRGK